MFCGEKIRLPLAVNKRVDGGDGDDDGGGGGGEDDRAGRTAYIAVAVESKGCKGGDMVAGLRGTRDI